MQGTGSCISAAWTPGQHRKDTQALVLCTSSTLLPSCCLSTSLLTPATAGHCRCQPLPAPPAPSLSGGTPSAPWPHLSAWLGHCQATVDGSLPLEAPGRAGLANAGKLEVGPRCPPAEPSVACPEVSCWQFPHTRSSRPRPGKPASPLSGRQQRQEPTGPEGPSGASRGELVSRRRGSPDLSPSPAPGV